MQHTQPVNSTFVQVFYGTERYKEFTACTLASLYHMRAGKTSRNDGTLYSIFIYLTVIRLAQDLPFPQYRQLVLSQDQTKLMVLLTFLFDAEIMRGVLREVWSTQFDHTYVDEQLLGGMRRQRAQMDELLSYLTAAVTGSLEGTMLAGTARPSTGDDDEEDANGGGDAGDADAAALMARPKKFTVPTPFNLTVPRAPVLPEPEPILNRPAPAKPMPDFSAQPSLADIEAAKERRKEEYRVLAEKKFREAAAPEIHSLKRPQHLERARAQVEAELAEKMRPLSPAKPPPALPNVAPVRLNAAAILREDALYKRKMEKEAQIIRAFESELRDDKEYYEYVLFVTSGVQSLQAVCNVIIFSRCCHFNIDVLLVSFLVPCSGGARPKKRSRTRKRRFASSSSRRIWSRRPRPRARRSHANSPRTSPSPRR